MGIQIESGGVIGTTAIVNKEGRLLTRSETVSVLAHAATEGNGFSVCSDFIALTTTASFSGILYFKNTNEQPFKIAQLTMNCTQTAQWYTYKNPTTGTLISGGTAKTPTNVDFGSGMLFSGTILSGADGLTVTDGSILNNIVSGIGHTSVNFDGGVIIRQNNTFAVTCKPSAAGTFAFCVLGYFEEAIVEE